MKSISIIITIVLAITASIFLTQPVMAQPPYDKVWTNPTDGNWSDPNNWNPVGVPNNTHEVGIIVSGSPYTITLDQDSEVSGLVINSPDVLLTIPTDNNLELDGNLSPFT
ncbi:hypothetical protein ACFLX5_06210, partial [Chloroflexota bacterium]